MTQNLKHSGGSAIDGRTTRHAGYALSQTIHKCIENLFGDGKQHRGLLRQRDVRKTGEIHTFKNTKQRAIKIMRNSTNC